MFDNVLHMVHNSPRVFGDNNLSAAGDPRAGWDLNNLEIDLDNPAIRYGAGLLTPFYGMLLVLVLWTMYVFTMCFLRGTRGRGCVNTPQLLATFMASAIIVVILLAWAAVALSVATEGVNIVVAGLSRFVDKAAAASASAVAAQGHATSASLLLEVANGVCGADAEADPPFPSIQTEAAAIAARAADIETILADVKKGLGDSEGNVRYYMKMVDVGVALATAVLCLVVTFFVVTSLARIYFPTTKAADVPLWTATPVWTAGTVVAILLALSVGPVSAVGLLGSDLCVPGVSKTLNGVLAVWVGADDVPDLCTTEPWNLLCYYQTCEGQNPLQPDLDAAGNTRDVLVALVDGYAQAFTDETCLAQLEAVRLKLDDVGDALSVIEGFVECQSINDIYVDITSRGTCDGLFKGLAAGYIFLFTSVVLFFAFLIIWELLDLRRKKYHTILT
jgi:hypothetical protein